MRKTILASLLFLAQAGAALAADSYAIDASHTTVGFSVRHMLVSNVKGAFNEVSGAILYDEKDVSKSSVNVTIKAASIDTANAKRDDHLRGGDFFDAVKFPEITFVSTKVGKKGADLLVTGTLTIKGVSKEASFPVTLSGPVKDPWGNVRIGAQAGLKINRQDYGVSWNALIEGGGAVVGDEVKIELEVEALKEKK